MKEFLSVILSCCMVFTSCTPTKSRSSSPAPAPTEPASQGQLQDANQQIAVEQAAQSSSTSAVGSNASELTNAAMNAAVDVMMKNGELYIRDLSGNEVSPETYRLNPSQYFVIFNENTAANEYQVLNTAAVGDSVTSYNLGYKIYKVTGNVADFNESVLGDPTINESLVLDANLASLIINRDKINDFIKSIKDANDLASNQSSMMNKVSGFLFPTAYAGNSTEDKYLTVAIVFTSVAVIAYLMAARGVGLVSVAVGISFWFLYWFLKSEND